MRGANGGKNEWGGGMQQREKVNNNGDDTRADTHTQGSTTDGRAKAPGSDAALGFGFLF